MLLKFIELKDLLPLWVCATKSILLSVPKHTVLFPLIVFSPTHSPLCCVQFGINSSQNLKRMTNLMAIKQVKTLITLVSSLQLMLYMRINTIWFSNFVLQRSHTVSLCKPFGSVCSRSIQTLFGFQATSLLSQSHNKSKLSMIPCFQSGRNNLWVLAILLQPYQWPRWSSTSNSKKHLHSNMSKKTPYNRNVNLAIPDICPLDPIKYCEAKDRFHNQWSYA